MKFSEAIRHINTNKFTRKGDLNEDAERYCAVYNWDNRLAEYIKLRLAFGETITVHTLTDGVVTKVRNTQICNMPHELPHFLTKPFIVEARHDNTLLSEEVVCISGYLDKTELCITATFKDTHSIFQYIEGVFDGRSLKDINFSALGTSAGGKRYLDDTNIIAFITVFALMIEAERTPIIIENARVRKQGSGNKVQPNNYKSDWIEKRVYIDTKYVPQYKSEIHGHLDTEGKVLKDVYVHGFLRHQACGPELKLRKYIYIEGFDSTRWGKYGHEKIIVDVYDK
jgi:hypothetical protein